MEKRFLLVLTISTILISLYNVYAQEEATGEQILGMSVSSLLVAIPLAMIILGLIFFLGLYLKDNYKNIVYNLKNKFKRRRIRDIRKKVTDYPKELQGLQKRLPILEPEEALQHLSNLAKKFFTEKINMGYEFTHRELEKELEKVNPNWASFPQRLANLRYSGEPLSKKEVNELINELQSIVKYEKRKRISLTLIEKLKKRSLIFEINILKNLKQYLEKTRPKEERLTSKDVAKYFVKKQKQRFLTLTGILRKIKTDMVTEIKIQLEVVNKLAEFFSNKLAERRIDRMLDLLEKSKKQIKQGQTEQAKNTYKQAYQLYYRLPIEEQTHIITELQQIQQKIHEYKPQLKISKTIIDRIKNQVQEFIRQKLTTKAINKTNDLIKEAQKQIKQGQTEQAKNTYKQAYQLYYRLPIEEQATALYQLRKIKDEIAGIEKEEERHEIEELSKELTKLRSEEDIYVIFDKGDIYKRLGYLANYIKKVSEQEIHGLKTGKDHLKEKLKDLVQKTEKIEQEEEKKLTHKEKKLLTKIKEFGAFFVKKEESLEKAFKQTQKQVSDQIHNITRQITTKPSHAPARKEQEHAERPIRTLPELKPQKPLIEFPKVKMDIERLKRLQEEEEKIIEEIQKPPRILPLPIQRMREKQHFKKYDWEATAEEIRRKKTRTTTDLLKEERDIQSKLKELEEL